MNLLHPNSAEMFNVDKRRVGGPRQQWTQYSNKYAWKNVLRKGRYENSANQNQELLISARSRHFWDRFRMPTVSPICQYRHETMAEKKLQNKHKQTTNQILVWDNQRLAVAFAGSLWRSTGGEEHIICLLATWVQIERLQQLQAHCLGRSSMVIPGNCLCMYVYTVIDYNILQLYDTVCIYK